MKQKQQLKKKMQVGQSLIETMVAVFILVMGITAALGLANYSFGASTNITKQIIGTGLAREGLEIVKNMRDTNWLKGQKYSDCYDYVAATTTASCYKDWLKALNANEGYDMNPAAASSTYKVGFDKSKMNSQENFWIFTQENSNFALDAATQTYAVDPSLISDGGFYFPASTVNGTSDYYRRITLTAENTRQPYTQSTIGPRLFVTSDVWWKDKQCPKVTTWEASKTACRIRLQMYLTNWRVY